MDARTGNADAKATESWPDEIFAILKKFKVRQVTYVPDGGHAKLIRQVHADPDMVPVTLTTEEEGVAILAGAWIGGDRGTLLMQSSGVGNCINMLSLVKTVNFPFFALVTMRGEFGEFNPWQVPMGSITEEVLRLSGFLTYRIETAEDVDEIVGAGCDMAFNGSLQVAVLLSQRLIGPKQWTR